ncbi:MAG: hypothetical protein ABI811_05890 [Acidobacteriota bacterium]
MKDTLKAKGKRQTGLQREYAFDYSKARPNRFAGKSLTETVVVMLDQDVSAVFKDVESVNAVLRGLIGSMPPLRKTGR